MKKAFLFLAALCMAANMWADTYIRYTATSKLEETLEQGQGGVGGLYIRGFNLPIQSHTFVNGVGTINFAGEVNTIKDYTFYGCTELTGITIPNSVTSIGNDAFDGCTNIETVTWNARNCVCDIKPFYSSRSKITSFTFGPEVEIIPDELCADLDKLTSVNIPNSVQIIGDYAFDDCGGLTSVVMGNGVKTIESRAFRWCENLTSVTLSNTLTSIGIQAFCCCTKLSSITLPATLKSIGAEAFYTCRKLTSIAIPNGVKFICEESFSGCARLTSIDLGQVEQIDETAFKNCTTLVSITIPETMKKIEADVFEGCTALTTVNWNANYCSNIVQTFSSLEDNITSFTFGPNVECISPMLCEGLTKLRSITIPASVRNIGARAFAGCTGLQEIHCEAVLPPYPSNQTFENVDFTIPVYIPYGTRSAYESTPGWSQFTNFIDPAEQSDPAAIESVETMQIGTKTILNGQVVILRDGKVYDLLGNEVYDIMGRLVINN